SRKAERRSFSPWLRFNLLLEQIAEQLVQVLRGLHRVSLLGSVELNSEGRGLDTLTRSQRVELLPDLLQQLGLLDSQVSELLVVLRRIGDGRSLQVVHGDADRELDELSVDHDTDIAPEGVLGLVLLAGGVGVRVGEIDGLEHVYIS